MNQLVQLAVTSVNKGDKSRAIEYLKQAIASNANDVDAWLVLSALVDQEDRKRQCLNRVLALDPVNRIAREELLKLNHAAIGNTPTPKTPNLPQDKPVQVSVPRPVAVPVIANLPKNLPAQNFMAPVSTVAQPQTLSQPATLQMKVGKPLVFRHPTFILIAVYSFGLIFAGSSVLALQDTTAFFVSCGLFFASLVSVWVVSAKVEVSGKGIAISRMFGLFRVRMEWGEIKKVKSLAAGQGLKLSPKKGLSLTIPSQVNGYLAIVQILQQKRPDLFVLVSSRRVHTR
jgi:hypothetical protein